MHELISHFFVEGRDVIDRFGVKVCELLLVALLRSVQELLTGVFVAISI